jgi:hypothetical protein
VPRAPAPPVMSGCGRSWDMLFAPVCCSDARPQQAGEHWRPFARLVRDACGSVNRSCLQQDEER